MWLVTTFGFFSIVQKPTDIDSGSLTIRARVRNDLLALKQKYIPDLGPIETSEDTDYRYRATASVIAVAAAFAQALQDVDYSNFKGMVEELQGVGRAKLYHNFWHDLLPMQNDPYFDPPEPKADSYGAILVSGGNKVLLREPKNHYAGYVWTFAKTKTSKGDAPEKTALVAAYQKTGYVGNIRAEIPGLFGTDDSLTGYFLTEVERMNAVVPNEQTASMRWVSFDEARDLIRQTTNEDGKNRDLAILDAAQATLGTIPYSEHIKVIPEDWPDLQEMPQRHQVLALRQWYCREDMEKIRRGFFPTVMEQKWFIVFESGRLRLHRSWTGNLIYDVGFEFDPQGGAYVSDVIVNRDSEQYSNTDADEDLELLRSIIHGHLLVPLEEPEVDGFVKGMQVALKANYLGSPDVVGKLIARFLDVIVHGYLSDPESRDDKLTARELEVLEDLPPDIDRDELARDVIQALSGMDSKYTTMSTWHTTGDLGIHIMDYLMPKLNFTGYESLFELVAAGIQQVNDKAYGILMGYFEDPDATWDDYVLPQLHHLHQFVTSVFLGTNTITYGKASLDDI